MDNYQNIIVKLEGFIKKYHTKVLVKGLLLFFAFGALFYFTVIGVEYMLWLGSSARLALLLVFIGVELLLLFRFVLTPLFYLFKIKRGIGYKEASLLIGKHFTEINDKLFNLLELVENDHKSELLLASIEQRSEGLKLVPFSKAVNFSENIKYLKFLAIPLLVLVVLWISGNVSSFFGSTKRIVNYDLAYEPPAPFKFNLLTSDLEALDTRSVVIRVITEGKVKPEAMYIIIEGQRKLLREEEGAFVYLFNPPLQSTDFHFEANGVTSPTYAIKALATPEINQFGLVLDFPKYTNRYREIINNTGNAVFPEGTRVTWTIDSRDTEKVSLMLLDTILLFNKSEGQFQLSRKVFADMDYEISTGNANVAQYERLGFGFKVIKDEYPSIKVIEKRDSLDPNTAYYFGEVSDDYALQKIQLAYYPSDDEEALKRVLINGPNKNVDQFYYTFPSGLDVTTGITYNYFFEVTDNDEVHGGKTTKSQVFGMRLLDGDALREKDLENQQRLIQDMDESLDKLKEQKDDLKELNDSQKENKNLDFNDQQRIKDFLQKQTQQESMMRRLSQELKENLGKQEEDKENGLLKERLERQELEAKKNERLLEELKAVADKLDKDELAKKLEELGKKQQNSQRSLEQLLELTKRYYVTEKAAQLARELQKLAEQQDSLPESFNKKDKLAEQEGLSKKFDSLTFDLKELRKDNDNLKKPIPLSDDKDLEMGIKDDQQVATDELKKENEAIDIEKKKEAENKAQQKQKAAAKKMEQLGEHLKEQAAGGGGSDSIAEDAKMLRQILDNLVQFSFKQEHLLGDIEQAETGVNRVSTTVKEQQKLIDLFKHVDDSLFALSLRRAELSEFVNEQVTEVYYNGDKALESLAEGQLYQGVSYQQYILSAANALSGFLADILDNMQQSMQMGQGSGKVGADFQLSNIIKAQGDLQKEMKGQGNSGQKGGEPQKEGQGDGQGSGNVGNQGAEGNKEGEGGKGGKGMGNGKQDGQTGGRNANGSKGSGGSQGKEVGQSEQELLEIYEIYKQQQAIRENLEEQLRNMINAGDRKLGEKILRQMEDFENELLRNGVTQQGMNKINTIQYELLKLENASMKQGKRPDRESTTGKSSFERPITTRPAVFEDFRNDNEILNRLPLPLRQDYINKVKDYFNSNGGVPF